MTAALTRPALSRDALIDSLIKTLEVAHRWRRDAKASQHDPEWKAKCLAEADACYRRAESYAARIGEAA